MSEDLQTALKKIDALTTKLETLGEFVSLNVATPPAHTASPPAPDANNIPVPSRKDFQVFRNNVRPRKRIILITKTDFRSSQTLLMTMRRK